MRTAWITAGMAWLSTTAISPVRADAPGVRSWAKFVVEAQTQAEEIPTLPAPLPRQRPSQAVLAARSMWSPVAIHARLTTAPETVKTALEVLERARSMLERWGWPLPPPDGGRGGTAGFDLYLSPLPSGLDAAAGFDAAVPWAFFDSGSTYAIVDPGCADMGTCVSQAYAEAMLLALDPGEARAWRRATAAWLAWRITGVSGCQRAVVQQQRQPWRSWIFGAADHGAGGALMLKMLSNRHSARGSENFWRNLWLLTRQRSAKPAVSVHRSPHLWEIVQGALEAAGQPLTNTMRDLATARFFAGARASIGTGFPALGRLLKSATVPLTATVSSTSLPARVRSSQPLQPYGSAYVMVELSGARTSTAQLWLRGSSEHRWALAAVRLSERGQMLGEIRSPPKDGSRVYLPVSLPDRTRKLLVVITLLPRSLPDPMAPVPEEPFELIIKG